MTRERYKFILALSFLMAISAFSQPRLKDFGRPNCENPVASHSGAQMPQSTRRRQSDRIDFSKIKQIINKPIYMMSINELLSQFALYVDTVSNLPTLARTADQNSALHFEYLKLAQDLRRYNDGYLEKDGVIYPKLYGSVGMANYVMERVTVLQDKTMDAGIRGSLGDFAQELLNRVHRTFRPALVLRGINDWIAMVETAQPRADRLLQTLAQLKEALVLRIGSGKKTTRVQLTQIDALFDLAIRGTQKLNTEFLTELRLHQQDESEAQVWAIRSVSAFPSDTRLAMSETLLQTGLQKIAKDRADNQGLFAGDSIVTKLAEQRFKQLTLQLLKVYAHDPLTN